MTLDRPSLITRITIVVIIAVQLILGLVFVLVPQQFSSLMGLAPAPGWTDWIFAMFGARALGFAYGMAVALKDIRRHSSWLTAMILVQAIDWIGTLMALAAGTVRLDQVTTASFLPVLFVIVLALELTRQRRARAS